MSSQSDSFFSQDNSFIAQSLNLYLNPQTPKQNRKKQEPVKKEHESFYMINKFKVLYREDLRTSIMIKNVPNKYDNISLMEEINSRMGYIDPGNYYNFLYTPIDFKNNCNHGYAFINFADVCFIPPFYEEFNLKKWNKFKSSKICELRYGRIQGKENLVKHF